MTPPRPEPDAADPPEEGVRDLLLLHATGCADPAERARAEALLAAGGPAVEAAAAEAAEAAAALCLTAPPAAPPAALRDELMRRVTDAPAPTPLSFPHRRSGAAPWRRLLAGAAAAAALGGALLWWGGGPRNSNAGPGPQRELRVEREDPAEAERLRLASLASPTLQRFEVEGAGAAGRLLFDGPRGRGHFRADGLAAPGPGGTYQLWCVDEAGGAMSLALFEPDAEGGVAFPVAFPPLAVRVVRVAVTGEPAAGSRLPTGAPVLAGGLE